MTNSITYNILNLKPHSQFERRGYFFANFAGFLKGPTFEKTLTVQAGSAHA